MQRHRLRFCAKSLFQVFFHVPRNSNAPLLRARGELGGVDHDAVHDDLGQCIFFVCGVFVNIKQTFSFFKFKKYSNKPPSPRRSHAWWAQGAGRGARFACHSRVITNERTNERTSERASEQASERARVRVCSRACASARGAGRAHRLTHKRRQLVDRVRDFVLLARAIPTVQTFRARLFNANNMRILTCEILVGVVVDSLLRYEH